MLSVKDLTVTIGTKTIVEDISFVAREGCWLMLMGPNGAGKSTVVKAIAQILPYTGTVTHDGTDLKTLTPVQTARRIGVLSQSHRVTYDFTVEEVVALGRYAHTKGALSARSDEDARQVEKALKLTGMAEFRHRAVTSLSGGELQRTFLAQVFAQNPSVLILDEPANHLDLVYQRQVFELIQQWLTGKGRTVISVVHDLTLARYYGTDGVLINEGRLAAAGTIEETLRPEQIDKIYKMDVKKYMAALRKPWE